MKSRTLQLGMSAPELSANKVSVVKQAKLSTRQTTSRLETRWREMKEIEKSETRERRGRTLNLSSHTYFTLFITILIGLPKLPYFPILYVWTEGHIPFRYFTDIGVYRKKP